jgi:hypothetical protein
MREPLGRNNPHDDALRLRTLALSSDSGAGGGAGSGLQNKIYVWHADGSTPGMYAATEAGLIAALSAAASGDTVWLPSIEIALAAAITLPAGIALIGIDESAVLSFTGFSGTAITMAAGAMCKNFSMVFVATGTTSLGIDARFAGALIDGVAVTVSGGSSSNVAIYIGAPEA